MRILIVLERECLDVSEAIGNLSEKQERIVGHSDGKEEVLAKKCSRKISGADLPGDEGAGVAEVKRGIGAVGTQAQVVKIGEGKGSSQEFTAIGTVRGRKRFCCGRRRFLFMFLLALYDV